MIAVLSYPSLCNILVEFGSFVSFVIASMFEFGKTLLNAASEKRRYGIVVTPWHKGTSTGTFWNYFHMSLF